MPELPEVQTVLDTLRYQIKDCKITDINVIYKPIVNCDLKEFNKLIGQHFRDFRRRGKYLLFIMDDVVLVSHLRMEGKYYLMDPEEPLSRHMHVIFSLDNGKQLRYNDVRKFGRMDSILWTMILIISRIWDQSLLMIVLITNMLNSISPE